MEDLPEPVDVQIEQNYQLVPSISTTECDMEKFTISSYPIRTSIGGMLIDDLA